MKDGGPAFPRPYSEDKFNDDTYLAQSGMTLRDYFAAKAMQGMVMAVGMDKCDSVVSPVPIARDAYRVADAMLAERIPATLSGSATAERGSSDGD